MTSDDDPWRDWSTRYRAEIRKKHSSLAKVAEKLGMAESTLRSWTNGNREVNLSDFFAMCRAGGVDPAVVLFGRPVMTEQAVTAARQIAASVDDAR